MANIGKLPDKAAIIADKVAEKFKIGFPPRRKWKRIFGGIAEIPYICNLIRRQE
ncbi:MAG: hypothetical protein K2O78_02800 [Muribaculaceae bacterium]|nr:hypothetical protein [Muribaculaceae bacterium]